MKPKPLTVDCAREIAGLCGLSRADLVARWVELHGSPPLKTMTENLLARAIAYEMQVRQFGGLTALSEENRLSLEGADPSVCG